MSNLRNEISSLSTAEKFELLDLFWESLEAKESAPTDEQQAELDHRASNYERDRSDVIPWEQVKRCLSKKAVILPVVWLPEADAELKEALLLYETIGPDWHGGSPPL